MLSQTFHAQSEDVRYLIQSPFASIEGAFESGSPARSKISGRTSGTGSKRCTIGCSACGFELRMQTIGLSGKVSPE